LTRKTEEAVFLVESVSDYSGGLVDWIEEQISEMEVSDEVGTTLMTVCAEIESNFLKHAFPSTHDSDEQKLKVTLSISDDTVQVTFLDSAPPFNPLTESSERKKNLEIGGRGIPLIKKLPDKIEYKRTADGQNKLTAHFNLD